MGLFSQDKEQKDEAPKGSNIGKIIGAVCLVVLLIVIIGVIAGNCSGSSSSSSNPEITAYYCSQEVVKEKLKAPSTAKFPPYSSSFVKDNGNSKYTVHAYVDAQNSFGATVRTYYTVNITLKSNGYYSYSSVVFD